MKIDEALINGHNACKKGLLWFTSRFPNGGESDDVILLLAAEHHPEWISWLIQKTGLTALPENLNTGGGYLYLRGTKLKSSKGY